MIVVNKNTFRTLKNLFFVIIFLHFFCTKTSVELCEKKPCHQIIPYFYFTNKDHDQTIFNQIETISAKNQVFIDSLAQFMNQLTLKINTEKYTFIDSIRKYLRRNQKVANSKEMTIKTYINTALIIKGLFNQENPLIKTIFQQLESIKLYERLITKIIDEIMNILDQKRTHDDFSFIIKKTWPLGKLPPLQDKNLFSTIKSLNLLFFKINTLIYWYHILQTFDNNLIQSKESYYSDAKTRIFRNETFNSIFNRINQRLSEQLNSISELKGSHDLASTKTIIENNVIDQISKWIQFNQTIIVNALEVSRCSCLYLQTEFFFKPLDMPLTTKDAYISKIYNYINEQAKIINNNHQPILNDKVDEFIYLYHFYQSIIPTTKFEMTMKEAFEKSIESKIQLFDQKINNIILKISRLWINQLKKESMQISLWQKISHYVYNKYRRKNYFFGFSLLSYSRQNPTTNRYTYMITQLESIFRLLNQLVEYQAVQPLHANNKIDELVIALKKYQKHFFMNKSNEALLQNTVLLPKKFHKSMLSELAQNKQDFNALQVGIEYVIIDRIIAWIEDNQAIVKNLKYQN